MIDFFCIHKKNDERSTRLANEAIQSGKKYNINVHLHEGVYSNIDGIMKDEGLVVNHWGKQKIRAIGVLGCFLSHYTLWKKCIDLNKPIGVLEYDAYFINSLPDNFLNSFKDYCNLDYTRHLYYGTGKELYLQNLEYDKLITIHPLEERAPEKRGSFKHMNNNHIKGAFGYVIKPSGATKLVTASKEFGILPADVQPNLNYCNVYYTTPSVVMLNMNSLYDRFSHTQTDQTE